MSRNNYWLACGLLCLLLAACSEEDGDGKDLDKPLIESGDSASPLNCQVYRTGEEIPFRYTFTDNDALGSYNIEFPHVGATTSRYTIISTTTATAPKQETVRWTKRNSPCIPGCTIRIFPYPEIPRYTMPM